MKEDDSDRLKKHKGREGIELEKAVINIVASVGRLETAIYQSREHLNELFGNGVNDIVENYVEKFQY